MHKTLLSNIVLITILIISNSINAQSIEALTKKANQNDAEAQYSLSMEYFVGKSIKKDDLKSFFWMEKSANNGYVYAKRDLAKKYEDGKGVKQNSEKATYWMRQAAEQGESSSQYELGMYYWYGKVIYQSDFRALEWIKKSAADNYEKAKHFIIEYDKMMVEKEKIADCEKRYQELSTEELNVKELIKKVNIAEENAKGDASKLNGMIEYLNVFPYKSGKTYEEAYEKYLLIKKTADESEAEYENVYYVSIKAADNYNYKLEQNNKKCQ